MLDVDVVHFCEGMVGVSFVLESCSSAQSCPGGIWHSTARVHNLSTETAQVFEFGRSQPSFCFTAHHRGDSHGGAV